VDPVAKLRGGLFWSLTLRPFVVVVAVVVVFFFLRMEWSRMLSSSVTRLTRGTSLVVVLTVSSSSITMGWQGDPRRRRVAIWVRDEDIV